MPRMEVVAAVAFAIALAYLWMRWDEHRDLRKKKLSKGSPARPVTGKIYKLGDAALCHSPGNRQRRSGVAGHKKNML